MSLLAHRGSMRRRSRSSGWLQQFGTTLRAVVLGGRRDVTVPRRAPRAGLARLGAVLACVGTGYLLGNAFPWNGKGNSELRVGRTGIAPGPLGETEDFQPLAKQFFVTALYEELALASTAAKALRQAGLPKARLKEMPRDGGRTTYLLVVYYDGAREQEQARTALLKADIGDATFADFRKDTKDWPLVREVR